MRRGLVILLVVVAVLAPWLSPHDPLEQDLLNTLARPSWFEGDSGFVLGTDSLGRDIISRILYGARASFAVAILAAAILLAVRMLTH